MKKVHFIIVLTFAAMTALFLFNSCDIKNEEVQVDWINSTLSSLTIEQEVGQMFCLTVDPIRYFFYPQYKNSINSLVSKYKPGGIYLTANLDSVKMEIRLEFNGNKLHDEIVSMQRLSNIPMFIGADCESGAWHWDYSATRFSYPLALGAIGSGEYSFRQGKITSVEARAQGINWVLMPDISINTGTDDVMLLLESLGDDSKIASDHSAQIIRGIQEARSLATMKYYPSPEVNSLLAVTPSAYSPDQVSVYQTGIHSSVATMMTSPVNPSSVPESAAENWNKGLSYLTETLGYTGIVVTQFLSSNSASTAARELEILKAGIDGGTNLFILPEIFGTSIPVLDLLVSDVVSGRFKSDRIDTTVKKIVAEKYDIGLNLPKIKQFMMYMYGLGLPEYEQNSRDIASASLTVLKNDNNIIPVNPTDKSVVSIAFLDDSSISFSTVFKEKLRERNDSVRHMDVFGAPDMRIRRELIRRAQYADIVLLSFFYKPAPNSGTVFSDELVSALKEIIKTNANIVATSYFDPTLIKLLPSTKAYIISYSPSEYSMEAVIDLILGISDANGKLPFHLSDEFPAGFGIPVSK